MLAVCFLLTVCGRAWGWGFVGHRIIAEEALLAMTPEMAVWYVDALEGVSDASLQPDTVLRKNDDEKWNHFINLDCLAASPFDALPREEPRAKQKAGRLPWRVVELYGLLVDAFRRGDTHGIIRLSGWLSHYLSDAYQPLHTTMNHDGQMTGNHGIHAAFEAEMINRNAASYRDAIRSGNMRGGKPEPIDDPAGFIRAAVISNYDLVAGLLEAETEAARQTEKENDEYYALLERLAGPLARKQMLNATRAVLRFWYTAWVEAGKPRPAVP